MRCLLMSGKSAGNGELNDARNDANVAAPNVPDRDLSNLDEIFEGRAPPLLDSVI